MIIWVFFVILDGEVEIIKFFASEAEAEAAKAAWLTSWAADNEVEFNDQNLDDVSYAAADDGYDIYIESGAV